MIILSGVLVVLAIALLVTGIVTGNTGHEVVGLDGLKLIYISIGVSIISALCLAIGVFLRRKELFGSAEAAASTKRSAARSRTARTAKAKARVGGPDDAPVSLASTTAIDVPAETSVYVVPGRKRYHLETCRQLAGRDKEELTYVEAREEGFTACTACLPDTALAARAAVTEAEAATETPAEETRPTESLESVTDTAELTRPGDDDPALVTRTDLPVTRLDDDELEIRPAAESPAAVDRTETPEPDTDRESASAETASSDAALDEPADTYETYEASEASEAPSETAAERSSARSRSFFEPLDDSDTAEETPTEEKGRDAEEDLTGSESVEPAESEDSYAEPEAAESAHEPSEPEAVETADAEATESSEPSELEQEPTAEAPAEAPAESEDPSTDEATSETDEADKADEADEEPDHDAGEPDAAEDEAATTGEESPGLPRVRILSGTKRYHRPNCALIEDIAEDADDMETLSQAEAKERGCTPCLVCQPDKDPSDDSY